MKSLSKVISASTILLKNYLPLTIRNVVEFVRLLGERFLWVDALCIDQLDVKEQIK
jgi:hypothetical protein